MKESVVIGYKVLRIPRIGQTQDTNINELEMENDMKKGNNPDRNWYRKSKGIMLLRISPYSILLVLITAFTIMNSAFSQSIPEATIATKSTVDSLLNSPDFFVRYDGAKLIFKTSDFDTSWAFQTIINGIGFENKNIKRTGFHFEYFQANPDRLLSDYVSDLVALSKNSPNRLEQYSMSLTGETKDWPRCARMASFRSILGWTSPGS